MTNWQDHTDSKGRQYAKASVGQFDLQAYELVRWRESDPNGFGFRVSLPKGPGWSSHDERSHESPTPTLDAAKRAAMKCGADWVSEMRAVVAEIDEMVNP